MITIKSSAEIELMRKANLIVRDTLNMLQDKIRVGMTTKQLDRLAHDYILKQNAIPSFLGYSGYPASVCISINEEVVHGIPSERVIKEGDLVSIDCGSIYKGYNGDAARTFLMEGADEEKVQLAEVTKQSFFEGMKVLKAGARLGDLGHAIQSYAESFGYGVVRAMVGHGIGRDMHEDPEVPNYGVAGRGLRLKAGMTIAVEPMINAGTYDVEMLDDGWTIVTKDNRPSAHYENTVLITEDGVEILSL
ncbi:MAG: type I methionyl aminopeptidase [Clostridia bacterium]|nr:type I methionyl aminopeptidase [Clostridia bacterium]MDY4083057.1 type I methionyl aminopeptidase [Eubacteriales bacterium]